MKLNKNIYYIKTISENEFIVYNSIRHIPIKIDQIGKKFFDHILHLQKLQDCLTNIPLSEHDEFIEFYNTLKKIKFFSQNEENTDKSYLLERFDEDKKFFYLHITDRCNLECSYCYNRESRNSKSDLNFEKWKNIIDKIIPYANKILLTGGEVTLHKHFKEIVKYIKQNNNKVEVCIISNGSLDYEKMELESTLKLIDHIDFSCDNIKDNNHERIGFNREIFLKNLKYFEKLEMTNKISIATVWTKNGLDNIKEIESFCHEKGIGFSMTLCIPHKPEDIIKMPSVSEHVDYIKSHAKHRLSTDNEVEDPGNKLCTCKAASTTFSIDAKGNCYPCQSFHFPIFNLGNLLECEFEDIYNSNIAAMLRVSNDIINECI